MHLDIVRSPYYFLRAGKRSPRLWTATHRSSSQFYQVMRNIFRTWFISSGSIMGLFTLRTQQWRTPLLIIEVFTWTLNIFWHLLSVFDYIRNTGRTKICSKTNMKGKFVVTILSYVIFVESVVYFIPAVLIFPENTFFSRYLYLVFIILFVCMYSSDKLRNHLLDRF